VPVCEQSFGALKEATERAARLGDLVELRLDCLDPNELNIADSAIDDWLPTLERPAIVTLRPSSQGGPRPLDQQFRRDFLKRRTTADFLDIEFDLASALFSDAAASVDWDRIICSHHDFVAVPADLRQIYERMLALPARILKIAVQANDAVDCLAVFSLLEQANTDDRPMIAIALGIAGITTRILGPSYGAFLTYASSNFARATGPGQLTAEEMEDLFHVRQINQATMITGLVGTPVAHSISPAIHNAAFTASGVDVVYIPFEVRDLNSFIKRMVKPQTRELAWNLRGLSVTAPHKSSVMDHLNWTDSAALQIGAVNTIVIEGDQLHGYNTDGAALMQPLSERLGRLNGAQCAVLGAGGAARAALWSLRNAGASVTLFARDLSKAEPMAEKFSAVCHKLDGSRFQNFDVVINATPLGTSGGLVEETAAVADQLRGVRLAYDLVYNPSETRFLREARAAGCEILGGLDMLVAQALVQFKLWTGVDPPQQVMRESAVKALK
jgi:3-dehydroquinate dehydratase/shikimate dehydrogenase